LFKFLPIAGLERQKVRAIFAEFFKKLRYCVAVAKRLNSFVGVYPRPNIGIRFTGGDKPRPYKNFPKIGFCANTIQYRKTCKKLTALLR